MSFKNTTRSFIILFVLQFCLWKPASSQMSITGPTCVQLGVSYQYTISGPWSPSTFMQWSVSGGTITGPNGSQSSGTPFPTIYVTWQSTSGSVSVTTSNPSGNASKSVGVSSTLTGGSLSNTSQTITYNTTPATINSSTSASGGGCTPSYAYQWQKSTDNINFSDISGQTGLSLTFSAPLTTTTYYRRKVTETSSSSVAYSNTATVTVMPQLYGNVVLPASQDIFVGSAASNLSSPPASGGNCGGSYTYSWQSSTDGTNFTDIGGGTANGFTPGSPSQTIYYRRKVVCGSELGYSSAAVIHVYSHLSIGNISPGSMTIAYNTNPGTLSASASGGICGSYSYQWQTSTDYVNWTAVSGATSSSYSPGNLTSTKIYRLQAVCGSETVYTNQVTITVAPPLQIGALGGGATPIYYNTSPGNLTVTGTTGGNCGAYSYLWQKSTDNVNFNTISGATASSYNPGNLTVTTYYKVTITCGSESGTTNTYTITVYPQLIAGTLTSPVGSAITYNTAPGTITGTAATGGGCGGSYSYQWEKSTDNVNFSTIAGATATNYAPGNLTVTTYYRRKVTCGAENIYSNTVTITVSPPLAVGSISPQSLSIAFGSSPGTLTSNAASGGNCGGTYSYQWQQSADNVTFNNIAGATSLTYAAGNLVVTTYYKMKVSCGSETAYSTVATVTVGAYTCTDMNFIQVRDIQKPGIINVTSADQLTNLGDAKQATQYFDGLGRVVQTVAKKGSLITNQTPTDLVNITVYDSLGREIYKMLPYASSSSDGSYKCDAFAAQNSFNASRYGDEQYYYGMNVFEPSPLNRVTETFAPGNNWVGTSTQANEANRHSIKNKYWFNTAIDSVRIWNVTDVANSFGTYATTSIYAAGSLYKNVVSDEGNNQVIEFKDKEGRVILKKVQLNALADDGSGKGHYGWLCTYYIYDDLNHLRAVIQPAGVESLRVGSWSLTATILNEQCFRYEYDYKERMIMKKVPGAGVIYMIYDARDRMVMSQDSVMRTTKKWMYTLYDALNRPTTTGLITDNTNYRNPSYHWSHADTSIAWPNPAGFNGNEELTKTFYDDYAWRSGEGNPLSANRSVSYDSYLQTPSNNTWPYPQNATIQSTQIRGMVTGTKTKVVGSTSTYLYAVSFYDDKARATQVQSTNVTGDSTIATTQYGFTGQPLLTITREGKAGTNAQISVALTQISYDSIGRVIKTEKKISNTKVNAGVMPSVWKTTATNEYDALGLLKKKTLSPTGGSSGGPLESLAYDYNIRGWMLGMNRSYVKDTTSTTNWFGFDLGYDKTSFTVNGTNQIYAAAQYNGNITGMLWRSTGDDYLRKYDFTYDAVNRLTGADFNQLNSNSFSKAAQIDFSVKNLSYDANGNILKMDQKGWKLGGSVTIDSLLYTYTAGTNKLKNVIDRKNDTATVLGDFRSSKAYMTVLNNNKTTSATDYTYDVNGNLTLDKNKDISKIIYNFLNLPDSIQITGKGTIKYVYDAGGNKLKKIVTDSTASLKKTTTLYLFGNFVNDTLQFLPQEEGRVRFKVADSSLQYDYFLKDHLGNVRMILTEQKDTNFYPPASLETAQLSDERTWYSKVDSGRVDKSTVTGYPTDPYTNPNDFIQKLNGNGVKIGTGIVLKVMAGDQFNVRVSSWWSSGNTPGTPISPLDDIVAALAGGVGSIPGKPSSSQLISSGILPPNATNFLNSESGYITSRPKAFVNWVLFDERFNYVSSSSGFEQVGTSGVFTTHVKNNLTLGKSGYLYVYVSNETPNIDVFFDNLQVTHVRGQVVSEDHYYPYGERMFNLCDAALNFGSPETQKKKYNGIDWQNDLGLNEYDAQLRTLDPQVGRWWQVDPKTENQEMWSPYASNYNNPILNSDLLGDEPECCKELWDEVKSAAKETWNAAADGYVAVARWTNDNLNPLATAAELVTGKTVNSNFTESKPRVESTLQLLTFVNPEAKAEQIVAKTVAKDVVEAGVKDVVKTETKQALKTTEKTASKESIVVTKDGVALPKGDKYKIPSNYVENPNRSGSYGIIENGKFKEKLRIDPATPPGKKGPNYSHYHLDGKSEHLSPNGNDKDPGFKH